MHEAHARVGDGEGVASAPNAPGMASATISIAAIAAKIDSRTASRSVSTSLVSHA